MMKKNVCQFWFVIHYFQQFKLLIFLFLAFPASHASPAIKPLKTGLPDYLDYNTGGKIRLRSSVVASWPEYFSSCSQSKKK
tara:strand:- start:146 stop:388 length:243 start_codon:yes stop_codon:yes gene_type:complete